MGNGYTTTLPLEVFTQRNFVVDFIRSIRLKFEFYFLKTKNAFEPPFGDLIRGIVYTPSIARWKARGRLPIRHTWTIFVIFYGWDVTSGNLSKSAFSKGRVTLSANFRRKRQSPNNHCWCQLEWLPFVLYQNIRSALFAFVTNHACDRRTDGRTERQTELRLPRPR